MDFFSYLNSRRLSAIGAKSPRFDSWICGTGSYLALCNFLAFIHRSSREGPLGPKSGDNLTSCKVITNAY